MDTLKIINAIRPEPVRGAGCCIALAPSHVSDAEAVEHARTFAALSDPTRIGILALLAAQDVPLCVCEINTAFPLGQPTISHHLKQLREAGLVEWEKRGLWVYYAVNRPRIGQVAAFVGSIRRERESTGNGGARC
ncbi:MAG: winged helix-turn-helix transcriptional regulator [SAR202 cluster bacterium]|nr:winged helix-turn-helix transcriptional regulator [SAR202 cluster bacterium]